VKKVADDEVVVERAATDKRVMDVTAGEKAVSDTRLSPLLLRWRELRGLSYQAALLPLPSIGSMAPGSPLYVVGPCICPSLLYAYFVSPGFFIVQCVSL
jgi:hypothetical protein